MRQRCPLRNRSCLAAVLLAAACSGSGRREQPTPAPSPHLSTVDLGSASDLPADGATPALLTATVRDASGRALPDVPLLVDVSGSGHEVTPSRITTDAGGSATIAVRSVRAEAKTIQLRASLPLGDIDVGPAHRVRFVATEPVGARCTVSVPAAFAPADGTERVPVEVTVRDRHDNLVAGRRVELLVEEPHGLVTPPERPTGDDGRAVGWVASLLAGRIRVAARVDGPAGPIAIPWTGEAFFADRARVAPAVAYADLDRDGRCGPGDTLTIPFTQDVDLARPLPADDLLALPVPGDALGSGAQVRAGREHDRLTVVLGAGARLRGRGTFDPARRVRDAASGLDLAGVSPLLTSTATALAAAAHTPSDVFADFVRAPVVTTGTVVALACGDVDRDGIPDLVLGAADGAVQLWCGRAGHGLSPPSTIHRLDEPVGAVIVRDLDRDGRADVVVAGIADTLRWLRNLGAAEFAPAVEVLPLGGRALAASDFDGDGGLELLLAGADGRAWVGHAIGSAKPVPAFATGHAARSLAVADFDLDGDLDVAVDSSGTTVTSFANLGGLRFAQAQVLPHGDPLAVAAADVDRDGDPDLVCVGLGGTRTWRNERARGFMPDTPLDDRGANSIEALDVDQDGDLDLLLGGPGGGLWRNDGGAFVRLPTSLAWEAVVASAAADFDRDGDLDLVTLRLGAGPAFHTSSAAAIRGVLALEMTAPASAAVDVTAQVLADVDRDGDLDVVYAVRGGGGRILCNDGHGNFADSGQVLGAFDYTLALAVGDLDRDGDVDVITGNTVGAPEYVHLNDGSGRFVESPQALGNGHTSALALGDVDGDGDLDLVVGNLGAGSETNRLFRNDGGGSFTDSGLALGSLETRALALVDLDRDGDLDLLQADTRGEVQIWMNDGGGALRDTGTRLRQGRIAGLDLGDLDGDGDFDLFVAGADGSGDRVWRNDGGELTDSGQRLGTHFATGVRLGDLDGDGLLDALVTTFGGPSRLWVNGGGGTFTPSAAVIPAGRAAVLGDLDRDGTLDGFLRADDGTLRLLRAH